MDSSRLLERAVSEWANSKSANVTVDSYEYEFETWAALTGEKSFTHVVDVGCGAGLFDVAAVVLGYADRATGIDPTEEAHGTKRAELTKTSALVADLDLSERVSFVHGYWPDVSVPKCDLLVFRSSLHHILEGGRSEEQLVEDLRSARESVADGGYIYVKEPSPANRALWHLHQSYRFFRRNSPHTTRGKRTVDEWKSILERSGFKNVRFTRLPPNLFINSPVPPSLTRYLSRMYLISGEK